MSVGSDGDKERQPPPDAEIDDRFGIVLSERYRIGELLGTGGMGRVYAAEHVLMRKKLAVKVLHQELSSVPEIVTRFKREAMAAANIDHPNVAAATDFGKLEDGSVFLVLEYVKGVSLREVIDGGPLSQPRVLHIARQIASALASAHALDIVHRDLKPENVMLVRKGYDPDFVKVLDFGIAKVPIQELSERGSLRPGQQITKIGMVFGTPEYMAPEQALGQPVDGRADLYALGVMMFEMLAGVRPYASSSQVGMLGQQLSMPVPRVADRAPGVEVAESIEELLQELLNKESSMRPESARLVVERLDQMIRVSSRAPGGRTSVRVEPGPMAVPGRSIKSLLGATAPRPRAGAGVLGVPPPISGPPRRVVAPPPSRRPLPPARGADAPLAALPVPPRLDVSPESPRVAPDLAAAQAAPDQLPPPGRDAPTIIEAVAAPPLAEVDAGTPSSDSGEALQEVHEVAAGGQADSGIDRAGATGAEAPVLEPVDVGDGALQRALRGCLATWERGVRWVEGSRASWPQPLGELLLKVPSSAVLGGALVLGVAVVLGGLVLVAAPGGGTEPEAKPAVSAQQVRSSAPRSSRSETNANVASRHEDRVSEGELGRAKQEGAAALEQLARRFPEDPAISVELAKAYRLEKRYPEVISQIRRLLELDPAMSRDAEVATLLWQSAQKQDSRDAAFDVLRGPMGGRGADILFDLASTRGIRADVKALAEQYFASPGFANVASDALKVAVALKDAKTCEEKKALLARAERSGDRRALGFLRTLEPTSGCGPRGRADCYPCLRGDGALEKVIAAIDARTQK